MKRIRSSEAIEKEKLRLSQRVCLKDQFERWNTLHNKLGHENDAQTAKVLLDA